MPYSARLRTALHVTHRSRLHRRLPELDTGLDSYPKRGKNLPNEKMCHFGNGDPAGQGPWMAMWVVQAHREKQIGHMGAAEFGLDSTEVRGWALCPVALGLSCPR